MKPSDISREALSWLGVPFHWQGRSRAGLDCGGLAAVVAESLGLLTSPLEAPAYRPPTPHQFLLRELRKYMLERPSGSVRKGCAGASIQCCPDCLTELAGTVVVVGIRRDHCGIATDDGRLVWVGQDAGCHAIPMSDEILRHTRNVFEFPGVVYR